MITFRKFLVEKIVGNTGWVYHRTKDNPEGSDIVTQGIKPSTNQSAMYGKGLYCCYDLDQQLKSEMKQYGDYILKGKIDLNGFAILDEDIYRLANPRGNFESHLRKIGTDIEEVGNVPLYLNAYTSVIAQKIWRNCKQKGYSGIIFTGETDGKVAVIWNRRNFIPYSYTEDDGNSWEKLNPDISSIKRKEDPEYDKDDEALNFSKILRELKYKEEIKNLTIPPTYNGIVYLKELKKCGSIYFNDSARIPNSKLKLILPKLQKCGNINAHFSVIEIDLPELQECGYIDAYDVKKINLPKLRGSAYIGAENATEINLNNLQSSGRISFGNAAKINLPQLQTSGNIDVGVAKELNLPELKECGDILAKLVKEINLPKLQKSGNIDITYTLKANLPELLVSGIINAEGATEINLSKLKNINDGVINITNASTITIPRKFMENNARNVKWNAFLDGFKFIHPDVDPKIEVNENVTFKKYLMLKEKSSLLNEWTREIMPEIYAALEKYDDPMVGVHFSKGVGEDGKKKTPHIGLNMNPFHHDPIGIYAFPKDYVLEGSLERNAGFRDSVNYYIVKPSSRANVLNLSTMSDQDAIDILKKMGIGENAYRNQNIYHRSGKMDVGHRFWGTLEVMRKQIYGEHSKNVSWNNLFKKTGYNVLYDDGDGIIHSNEPSQIVYLDSSAMEILDQGKQDDQRNKIYSFFIKQFPELRPQKTKDIWGHNVLKMISDKGYYLIISLPDKGLDAYSSMRISIINQSSGHTKLLGEFGIGGELMDELAQALKEKIANIEGEYEKQGEREVPPVLEGISKRFNIKLKKDKRGDWEIRQNYQDADKKYIITFYIRYHKDEIFFVLNKKQKSMNYNTFGYNEAARVEYRERYTPEQIVEMGLKELEFKRYGSVSVNQDAMKTIEFLRKRVFRL